MSIPPYNPRQEWLGTFEPGTDPPTRVQPKAAGITSAPGYPVLTPTPPDPWFTYQDAAGRVLVACHRDGTVTLGAGVSLDTASQLFWEAVAGYGAPL